MNKHIDPLPDRRYIIRDNSGNIDSVTVIEATDRHVRLRWEGAWVKRWHRWSDFQPLSNPADPRYLYFQILEELETK
jgi:hypothetical protein